MGFFSGYGRDGMVHGALGGLARLTSRTGAPSKDARKVVSAFMRGEIARGACRQGKGCGIISTGTQLRVNDPEGSKSFALAKRDRPDADYVDVCVPSDATYAPDKKGKYREMEQSRDIKVAASALLKSVGAGVGVTTDEMGVRRLTTGRKAARVQVPVGQCLRVKLSPRQRIVAAQAVEAYNYVASRDPKRLPPTAAMYAKARAAVAKEKQALVAAQRAMLLEQKNKERGFLNAEKRLKKLEADRKRIEDNLFKARENMTKIGAEAGVLTQLPPGYLEMKMKEAEAKRRAASRKPAAPKGGGKKGKK